MSQKALIIHADLELSDQLQDALLRLGIEVETTTNGNEGVDLASLDQPAIVFLGLMDNKGAGYGLCSKLRRRAADVPVVMVIERDEEESDRLDRHRVLKTSADAYLVRPFTVALLAATLQQLAPGIIDADAISPDAASDLVGETNIVPNDSLLGGSLFDEDELKELEAEADKAFSSIVSEPVGGSVSREFELDDLDLLQFDGAEPEDGAELDDAGVNEVSDDDIEDALPEEGTAVFNVHELRAQMEAEMRVPPTTTPNPSPTRDEFDFEDVAAETPRPGPDMSPEMATDMATDMAATPTASGARPQAPDQGPPQGSQLADAAFSEAEQLAHEAAQVDRDNRSLRARVVELQQELKIAREEVTRRET
ncbi:MAG: response regulator transcription factor, partial [Myxococcales bacterium]|nr:response regulator transcription factor [Myxococcales bacterium]